MTESATLPMKTWSFSLPPRRFRNGTSIALLFDLLTFGISGVRGGESPAIAFTDDFTQGMAQWEVVTGTWRVERGQLVGTGHGGGIDAWIYAGDTAWTDYSLSATVSFDDMETEFVVRSTGHWENEYRIGIWLHPYMDQYHLQLARYDKGDVSPILGDGIPSPVPITNPAKVQVTVVGATLALFINDLMAFSWVDSEPLPSGRIGLGAIWEETGRFDDVIVLDLSVPPTIPAFLRQPVNQDVSAGGDVVFEVQALGEEPLRYQWQRNGSSLVNGGRIDGSDTPSLRIRAVTPEDAGVYSVIVSNVHGSVASHPAGLMVVLRPPEITTQPAHLTIVSGHPATLTVTANGALPLTYQWRRNGTDLDDDGRISGAQTRTLSLEAVGLEDLGLYTVVIRNDYGSITSAPATLTVTLESPGILSHPEDQLVFSGSEVMFRVSAVGSLPLHYQWQHDGADLNDGGRIRGSQTDTLHIAAAGEADLGSYAVEVGNAYGRTLSLPALLTVVMGPPTLTLEPQGQDVVLGSTVRLRVAATGSLPLRYQWQRDGVTLVDADRVSGATTTELTISDLHLADLGHYSVVVENSFGRQESRRVAVGTSSILLSIEREGASLLVRWNGAGSGARLQIASDLTAPLWREVEGSESTSSVILPLSQEASAFFRLVGE